MRGDGTLLALYLAHRGELVKYASNIVGDRAHAEDVVQEAYLRFGAVAGRGPLDEPLGYLYRIVRNLAIDSRRRHARSARYHETDGEAATLQARLDEPSPEVEAIARNELRLLTAALAELPERTRIALEMHRFGGCKLREIAGHLGISVTLAHDLVAQGVEHCRRRVRRPL